MKEALEIAQDIVANKFTALLLAIAALALTSKHLIANVKYRREGLEKRIRFLESQVLDCSGTEVNLVGVAHGMHSLLVASSGGDRIAFREQITELGTRLEEIMTDVGARNKMLKTHFAVKETNIRG